MAQEYDKIFKENFEVLIHSLARVILKIDTNQLEEVPDDNHYTIEKRPDFLKKVKGKRREDDYILQLEVQTTDPKSMIKRMLIYYGLLYHNYGIPVKQYVLYIGRKSEAKMPTLIEHTNLKFKFHLINIADLDHKIFLYSDQPEDIVISILCDFKDQRSDTILETIFERLRLFSKDTLALGKYLKQLEILSNLRNLQKLTVKKLNDMPFIYDLETDIRYKQGYAKAAKEAKKALDAEKVAAAKAIKEAKKEARKKAEEARKKAEEARRKAEEARRKEEEARREAEEARKKAEEARKKAEEARKKAEEARKKAEEALKAQGISIEEVRIFNENEAAVEKARKSVLEQKENLIKNLLDTKILTIEYIAKITSTTIEYVKELEQKLSAEKTNSSQKETDRS